MDSPLLSAIIMEDYKTAMLLIESSKQEDLDVQDLYGMTALHLSVFLNAYGVFRRLIERGARMDVRDHGGNTPIHVACEKGRARFVGFMLFLDNSGVNAPNGDGHRPVHLATLKGSKSVLAVLRDEGADMNARDGCKPGATPLHYAIKSLNRDMVRYLVEECGAKASDRLGDDTPQQVLSVAVRDLVHDILKWV
jgi:ankyrin repeat protein